MASASANAGTIAFLASLLVLVLAGPLALVAGQPTVSCWTPANYTTVFDGQPCPRPGYHDLANELRVDHFSLFDVSSTVQYVIVAATNGLHRLNPALGAVSQEITFRKMTTCPFRPSSHPFLCTGTVSILERIGTADNLLYCQSGYRKPACSVQDIKNWSPVSGTVFNSLPADVYLTSSTAHEPYPFVPDYNHFPVPQVTRLSASAGIFTALLGLERIVRFSGTTTPNYLIASPTQLNRTLVDSNSNSQLVYEWEDNGYWYLLINSGSPFADTSRALVFGSFVARVCMADSGQPSGNTKYNYFSNLMKAQLLCQRKLAAGAQASPLETTFRYTSVTSAYSMMASAIYPNIPLLYASFTVSPTARALNAERGSAVCVYHRTAGTQSIQSVFQPPTKVYMPDGSTPTINSGACSDKIDTDLIADGIEQISEPVYYSPSDVLTATAAVQVVSFTASQRYDVLVVAHDNGTLSKILILNGLGSYHIIETFQVATVLTERDQIHTLKFTDETATASSFIYVQSKILLITTPFAKCGLRRTCRECVALRDPLCGWSTSASACNSDKNGLQSITTLDTSGCHTLPIAYRVTVTTASETFVLLAFTAVVAEPAAYDKPRFDVYQNGSKIGTVPKGSFTFNASDLDPFTFYGFHVVPINNAGAGSPSDVSMATTLQIPPEAARLGGTASLSGRVVIVTLGWLRPVVNGALRSYQVLAGSSSANLSNITTLTGGRLDSFQQTYSLTNLSPSSTYWYAVITCNAPGGLCTRSNVISVTTPCLSPPAIGFVGAARASAYSVTLSWARLPASAGVPTAYRLLYHPSLQSVAGCCSGLDTNFTIQRLSPFTNYTFVLEGATCGGYGNRSQPIRVMTLDGPPPEPMLNLVKLDLSTGLPRAIVSWSVLPGPPFGTLLPYQVCRDPAFSSGPCITLPSAGQTTYTDSSVLPAQVGTTPVPACNVYHYTVKSSTKFGAVASRRPATVHVSGEAPSVTSLRVLPLSETQIFAQWEAPVHDALCPIVNYTLLRDGQPVCCQGAQTEYVDFGLSPSQRYVYSVHAETRYVGAKVMPFLIKEATTLDGHPSAVRALAYTVGGGDVVLNWTLPNNTNGVVLNYVVRRDGGVRQDIGRTSLQFRDPLSSLTGGWTYLYSVAAETSAGLGPPAMVVVATPAKIPDAPQSINFIPTTHTAATVSWVPPVYRGLLTGFVVRVQEVGGQLHSSMNISSGSLLLTSVGGLVTGRQYYAEVMAISVAGTSPIQSSATVRMPLRISPVTIPQLFSMTVTARVAFSLIVSWTAANTSAVLRYTLEQQRTDLGPRAWTEVCCTAAWTSYNAGNLSGNAPYRFRLSATLVDNSTLINVVTQTGRTISSTPTAPRSLVATALSPSSVQLSWSLPAELNGIVAHYQILQDGVILSQSTTLTAFAVDNLAPYSDHVFRVRAVNLGDLEGPFGTAATVRTLPSTPSAAQAMEAIAINQTALRISWVAPAASNGVITGYEVQVSPVDDGTRSCRFLADVITQPVNSSRLFTYVGSLKGDQLYCVRVRCSNKAVGGGGQSVWSPTRAVQTWAGDVDCSLSRPAPCPVLVEATAATDVPAKAACPTEPDGFEQHGVTISSAATSLSSSTVAVIVLAVLGGMVTVVLALVYYKRYIMQKKRRLVAKVKPDLKPVAMTLVEAGAVAAETGAYTNGSSMASFANSGVTGAGTAYSNGGGMATFGNPRQVLSSSGSSNAALTYLVDTLERDVPSPPKNPPPLLHPAADGNEATEDRDYEDMPEDLRPPAEKELGEEVPEPPPKLSAAYSDYEKPEDEAAGAGTQAASCSDDEVFGDDYEQAVEGNRLPVVFETDDPVPLDPNQLSRVVMGGDLYTQSDKFPGQAQPRELTRVTSVHSTTSDVFVAQHGMLSRVMSIQSTTSESTPLV